jgi:hypothetical protein
MGTMGTAGTSGSPDTETQVLAKFNSAVQAGGKVALGSVSYSDPKYDPRWQLAHSIALGVCVSAGGIVVFPDPQGITCAAACAANTGGNYKNCDAMVRVVTTTTFKPQTYGDQLGYAYKYSCTDINKADDPVAPTAQPNGPGYCCCH